MHIALISYEFPPETNYGGIGTYTHQLAFALAKRGHHIEVFASSPTQAIHHIALHKNILLHKVVASRRAVFSNSVVAIFRERHTIYPFDIVESPDFGAEGAGIRQAFPQIPFTIKLHAPLFLYNRYNKQQQNRSLFFLLKARVKQWLGHNSYYKENDYEYLFAKTAHSISAPSGFLANLIQCEWQFSNIKVVPNYYLPCTTLLNLPVRTHSKKVVAFIGRLEKLKGIHAIIKAIPGVVKQHPDVVFRFIGKPGLAPDGTTPMDVFMANVLRKYSANIAFAGYVPALKLADVLADVSVVIIPSLFENFPYVGLESMAAGKAVIISENSGMPAMFPPGEKGAIVINPRRPASLSKAVNRLLHHPDRCVQMGAINRQHVIQHFASDKLLEKVLQFYQDTIVVARGKAHYRHIS